MTRTNNLLKELKATDNLNLGIILTLGIGFDIILESRDTVNLEDSFINLPGGLRIMIVAAATQKLPKIKSGIKIAPSNIKIL